MSVLPDLERELRRAAARPRRRLLPATRGGLFVATGIVIAGGVAGATGLGLVGPAPKAFENFDQGIPTAITGRPVDGGRLLPIRVDDPNGGPPWGIRITITSRHAACLQVGRVVQDQLVVLGRDGAFDDDGRAHIRPVGQDICAPIDRSGTPVLRSRPATPTSSGLSMCPPRQTRASYERERRHEVAMHDQAFPDHRVRYRPATDAGWHRIEDGMCPKGSQRALRWGFLGPKATRATYRTPDGDTIAQALPAGGLGAYLFVRRIADGRQAHLVAVRDRGTVFASFGTARRLRITGPGHAKALPGLRAAAPAKQHRGPVDASFTVPRRRTDPVRVTFRAPVDALRYPTAFKAYVENVQSSDPAIETCRRAPTAGGQPSMPVAPSMRQGERATLSVAPPSRRRGERAAWCPGPHRLRLIQIGGAKKGYVDLASYGFTVK